MHFESPPIPVLGRLASTYQTNAIGDTITAKPKLVFFQYKYDERLPEFLLTHKREHIKCLAEFFNVQVIHEDCDYQQVCDTYEPEIAVFESGVNHATCQRLEIRNIRSHPEIPKLGLQHGDAFCNARAGFLSDMDHWGIETFFAISTTAAEHTREIAHNLFVWPVFIDAEVYHDYGVWKCIPVLFTGNRNQFYPWRTKIITLVSKHYPSLICPHPGYNSRSGKAHVMVGEDYARTINASWFVPACGTIAKEVVRKHFEVPGSKACLIAEKSAGLEAAGFVDMTNCVFADEHDVLAKLAYLFQRPDELRLITEAGYQLVHSRHTLKHRDQIFQWFTLYKGLKKHETIVQLNPFAPLVAIPDGSDIKRAHLTGDGLHLALLREGDGKLMKGKYEEAEKSYLRCVSYMPFMPEPKLRLALCSLYKGDARTALNWIEEPIEFTLCTYKAIDPDPVEWAYYIISLLCLGRIDDAVRCSSQFAWLRHPELDRARCVSVFLKNGKAAALTLKDDQSQRRYSMHELPTRTLKQWIEQVCLMLKACEQCDMAERLTRGGLPGVGIFRERQSDARAKGKSSVAQVEGQDKRRLSAGPLLLLNSKLLYRKLRLRLKGWVADILHHLEAKHGYFLPYQLSESRNDEFFKAVRSVACEEEIKTAVVIGAASGERCTEAVLTGLLENKNNPSIFCISGPRRRSLNAYRASGIHPSVKWYQLSPLYPNNPSDELEETVRRIREDNQINFFDLVLIDGSELKQQSSINGALTKALHAAGIVILDHLNGVCNYKIHDALLRDPNYLLGAHNPGLRDGYSIFVKCDGDRKRR